jgi:hypothetical protein
VLHKVDTLCNCDWHRRTSRIVVGHQSMRYSSNIARATPLVSSEVKRPPFARAKAGRPMASAATRVLRELAAIES